MKSRSSIKIAGILFCATLAAYGIASCHKKTRLPDICSATITITPMNSNLHPGSMEQFIATGILPNGEIQNFTTDLQWQSSDMSIATISLNGAIATGLAPGSTTITANATQCPNKDIPTVTLNVVLAAYVVNATGSPASVSYCPLSADGTFNGVCTQFNDNSFQGPFGIAINPSGTYAYVTNLDGNNISYCPLNPDGTFKAACSVFSGYSFSGSNATGITLNSAGTIAYIGNGTQVVMCALNLDGTFEGSCFSVGQTFTSPNGISLNPSGTQAYVANGSFGITYCPVSANGAFEGCTSYTDGGSLTALASITLNSSGTYAYTLNINGTSVFLCSVNPNGSIASCGTFTSSEFSTSALEGIALNPDNSAAYITNFNHSVFYCPLNADGTFVGSCSNFTDNSFHNPLGITIH